MNTRELAGTSLRSQICVIGAGPAGITIAESLRARGIDTVVLECGGAHPPVYGAFAGHAEGSLIEDGRRYMTETRLSGLGGSMAAWGGWCRPLDHMDFGRRSWVPESGWPISAAELRPYYARGSRLLRIANSWDVRGDDVTALRSTGLRMLPVTSRRAGAVDTVLLRRSAVGNLWQEFGDSLSSSPRIKIATHARVSEIVLDRNARRVEEVVVSGPRGTQFREQGRFYSGWHVARAGHVIRGALRIPPSVQRQMRLLNASFTIVPLSEDPEHARTARREFFERCGAHFYPRPSWHRSGPGRGTRFDVDYRTWKRRFAEGRSSYEVRSHFDRNRCSQSLNGVFFVRSEQAPSQENRVFVDRDNDRNGNGLTRVRWYINELEQRSVAVSAALIGEWLATSGRGHLAVSFPADRRRYFGGGACHHMGTTRMSDSPRRGVVDVNCRVHGIANLFVAGSSVFPTSGWANPTLTIVALALRLSDHIAYVS